MAKQGQVTKIYQLKTIGFPDLTKQLQTLTKQFDDVRKAKEGLNKQKNNAQDDEQIKKLNEQIKQQILLERDLTLQIKKKVAERKQQKLVEEAARQKQFSESLPENSIAKAKADNKALRAERELLNETLGTEKERIDAINEEINKNNELIERNSDILAKRKIQVGNYEGSAKIIVEALKSVENEIANLKSKQETLQNLSRTNPIGFKLAGGQDSLNQVNAQLSTATQKFEALDKVTSNPKFLNLASKVGDARTEVKGFTTTLIELERNGQGSSDFANELRNRLAQLTDQVGDTREEIKALSSDTRGFDLFSGSVTFAADAFQTFAGAAELAGLSEKDAAQATATLVAIQSVSNGVKGIAVELTKKGTAANIAYTFVQKLMNTVMAEGIFTARGLSAALGLIAIAATVIGGIVIAFQAFNRTLSASEQRARSFRDVMKESASSFTEAKVQVESLRAEIAAAKNGFISKTQVVKEYNDTIGKTTGQVKSLDEAEQELNKNAEAYIRFTLLKAAANIALGKAAEKAFEIQQDALKRSAGASTDLRREAFSRATVEEKKEYEKLSKELDALVLDPKQDQKLIDAKRRQLDDLFATFSERGFDATKKGQQAELENLFKTLFDQATTIAKDFKFNFFEQDPKKTDPAKDALAQIDTLRDIALAKEEKRVTEIRKVRDLSLGEEIAYANTIEEINAGALQKKIAYLTKTGKKDAETLKQIAEFGKDKVLLEKKLIDDVQKLKDDEFKKQEDALKKQLERDKQTAQNKAEDVSLDPRASAEQKAQAKKDSDAEILKLQEVFNKAIDALEKKYNQNSTDNAKAGAAAVLEIKRGLKQDEKDILLAQLEDLQKKDELELGETEIKFSKERQKILANDKLTKQQKDAQLAKLAKAQNITILTQELNQLNKELEAKKKLLDASLISDKEYQDAVLKAQQKAEQLQAAMSEKKSKKPFSIKQVVKNLLGLGDNDELDQLIGQVLAEAYQFAQEAMNNFFNAERDRIEENLRLQEERLDMEKQQVESRAQSQEEIDSIEKQYAAKKRAAELEAAEKLKKSKRAEAKIALATELANIAVSAAANPLNGPTFGAAGAIMYALLSGLAIGRYALRIGEINREKFEFGGQPGEVPTRGGEFGGRSHAQGGTDFQFRGRTYNAEAKELAVIRTKNAPANKRYTVSGTQAQIASAINQIGGGIAFKPGARFSKLDSGGYLGDVLQAPLYTPSSVLGGGGSSDVLTAIKEQTAVMQAMAIEQSKRVDRIEVVQKTSTVTDAQKKQAKQNAIGVL
jgi:hypothetical protein